MKKIIFLMLLSVFSMYYTNFSINLLRQKDPIMQEIKEKKANYEEKYIDAKIVDNTIIPGKYGKKVNVNKSYSNMERYGAYNEILTVMEEVKPSISIEDTFDKYIEKGNNTNKNVALIFLYDDNISKINGIIQKKHIPINIFIDGIYLEESKSLINKSNYQIELLSYDHKYEENTFKTSLSYLKSLTNREPHFCYTETINKELLSLCSKEKLHTIKPYLIIDNNLITNLKRNLTNGIIITIKSSSSNIYDLDSAIDYIINKGYDIVTLDTLIDENS